MKRIVQLIATLLLVVIIIYSFVFIGSPSHNRLLLEDKATLEQLKDLQCSVQRYYEAKGKMPEDIKEVLTYNKTAPISGPSSALCRTYCNIKPDEDFKDKNGAYFEYSAKGDTYSMCANFNFDWKALEKNNTNPAYTIIGTTELKDYTQGHFCFNEQIPTCKKLGEK